MKKLQEAHVPYNTGWAGELKKGQVIRILATTTVDFVCMRLDNLKERFDQARTKVYNMKFFITTGDKLMGRNNQHMMTIVENTNREGTHDLQKGMCSGYRFRRYPQSFQPQSAHENRRRHRPHGPYDGAAQAGQLRGP